MKNNLILKLVGILLLTILMAGCRPPGPVEYDQRQPVQASSDICEAAGVEAPCLRITNGSDQPLGELKLYFAAESITVGDVPAGATTPYIHVSLGVYSYAGYAYTIDGEMMGQGVTDYMGEVPLKGGAFTYVLAYDANYRAPLLVTLLTEDESNAILRKRATETPQPETQSASGEFANNTIDCFTAQELAEAVFGGYAYEQRTGGDAPFIDEQGVLNLHTTANDFDGDSGHRLLVHDAPVESYGMGFDFMRGANKWLNISVVELASRFADRSCDNDRSALPGIEAEIAAAPQLDASDLTQFQWENRLLLLFSPMPMERNYIDMMVGYEGLFHELIDRDMLWFHILARDQDYVDEGLRVKARLPQGLSSALAEMYNPESAAFKVVLIGKDGGVKHSTTEALLPRELFSIIDAMPMRQQEMKED